MNKPKFMDGSWADVPETKVRLFAVLGQEGWELKAYDLSVKGSPQTLESKPASNEQNARIRAELWAIAAHFYDGKKPLEWHSTN